MLDVLPIQCTQLVYIAVDLVVAHMLMGIAQRKNVAYASEPKLEIEEGEQATIWAVGAL